jgi:hypothetical protein
MFKNKSQRAQQAVGITFASDLTALEGTLRSILDIVEPCDAWEYLQPHADRVLERAGSLWPLAEDEIARMLEKYQVSRPMV